MPIYEYENKDTGERVEILALPGDSDSIGEPWVKVPSISGFVFDGAFSGGTSSAHMKHAEALTQPELKKHAKQQRDYQDEKFERQLDKHVEQHLAEFDL